MCPGRDLARAAGRSLPLPSGKPREMGRWRDNPSAHKRAFGGRCDPQGGPAWLNTHPPQPHALRGAHEIGRFQQHQALPQRQGIPGKARASASSRARAWLSIGLICVALLRFILSWTWGDVPCEQVVFSEFTLAQPHPPASFLPLELATLVPGQGLH